MRYLHPGAAAFQQAGNLLPLHLAAPQTATISD